MEEDIYKIRVDNNFRQASGDANALGASIEQVTTSSRENSQAVEQGAQAQQSFRAQIREANLELQRQIQLTGESSAETIAAARAVANLRDQMEFASQIADTFNPDQQMRALGAATQIAGTGLQGVTSGMALFGDQSADTQEQLLKVQAAMAFSDAISNLSNLGDQWQLLKAAIVSNSLVVKANTAATGAAAIVQNAFTGSVATTSTGFKALKFAIAATGIGLLVVGLAAVVVNFEKISKWANSFGWIKATAGWIGDLKNSVTDFIGVTSEADRIIDRMKANADASIALNKKFLAEHGSQLDEFTKQKIEAKNKYNEAVKEDGADQIALAKELNRELAKIEYSRGDEARKIQEENAKKAQEKQKELADKAREDAKAKADKEAQESNDLAERMGEKAREDYEKLQQIIKDAKKANEDSLKTENDLKVEAENARFEEEKQRLLDANLSIEEITAEHKRKIAELNDQYYASEADKAKSASDKEIEIEKEKADQKKAIQDGQLNLADSAVGFLSRIAGKNKTLQKAAIIAESALGIGKSVIATNTSNVAATAQGSALAIPTAGASVAAAAGLVTTNYVSLGLGIAGNIAATAKALQALGGGSAPSAGNIGGGGVTPQAPPTVAFNNTSENQIGQSVARSQGEQAPIQVVVAESDITNAQNNVKVLVDKNKV